MNYREMATADDPWTRFRAAPMLLKELDAWKRFALACEAANAPNGGMCAAVEYANAKAALREMGLL